jgi:glutamate synthase (NADPH/NADH) large chain
MAVMATTRSARWAPTRRSPCCPAARLLYDYFKQNFAQVTNPPIDPIREELVMSLVSMIGPRPNLLGRDAGSHKRLEVDQPILTNDDIAKIRSVEAALDGAFRTATIDTTWDAAAGAQGLELAIKEMCWAATEAVLADKNILILSDRAQCDSRIPMPALLATAAVHHHLVRQGLRMQTGLVVETGEAREVHHFCVLAGYGAEAINPYLAFETLEAIRVDKDCRSPPRTCRRTTSRRSARASSRSCPRWASRPISPIAARRSSTRSASAPPS